jgi:UDP-N-acetylglucosamine diphosphorylase/glucosamine-1-phosphate N-acetyltransferase
MNYILFDDESRNNLLPFTFTRPVAEIRFGILKITEKWELFLRKKVSFFTQDYLQKKYPIRFANGENNFWINGKICPDNNLLKEIKSLKVNQVLIYNNIIIAANTGLTAQFNPLHLSSNFEKIQSKFHPLYITAIHDIFTKNATAFTFDFEKITKGRKTTALGKSNLHIGKGKIFIEKGASVEGVIFNTKNGNIYIAKDAIVMEGSMIKGPFALCEHAEVKMGTKIYGATTIGPFSKVGGEINNSVIFGYSNKGHDGFLGNSVLGEWCNLGADTNNSNLKNNYSNVKLWNYEQHKMVDTGLQFCGLFMGDHSKCGINTMFNTGTIIGVNANVYGGGFPPTFIPSFSWGGSEGFEKYQFTKAIEVAKRVMERRNIKLSEEETKILEHIFKLKSA